MTKKKPLPFKANVTLYKITLPISNTTVKFRAFTVKEQKSILISLENPDMLMENITNVLKACTFGEVDIYNLPSADVEMLLLNIRAQSVNNIIELEYTCNNELKDGVCGQKITIKIDLVKDVEITEIPDTKIKLSGIGVEMLPMTFQSAIAYDKTTTERIADNIKLIYDEEDVYSATDYTKNELIEFVDSLTITDYTKLAEYIENTPTLIKELEVECINPDCKHKEKIVLKGLADFLE